MEWIFPLVLTTALVAPALHRALGDRTGGVLAIVPAGVALHAALSQWAVARGEFDTFREAWVPSLGIDRAFRVDWLGNLVVLGGSLAVAALAAHSGELGIGVRAFLIVLFFFLTAPVAAHRLARAAYQAGVPRWAGTVRDEFDEARGREPASPERP